MRFFVSPIFDGVVMDGQPIFEWWTPQLKYWMPYPLWPNTVPLIHLVKHRQLKFLGHILRMSKEEPARRYALYIPTIGKRRPGRPRTSYLNYVQRLLGDNEGSNARTVDCCACWWSSCMEKPCDCLLRSRWMMMMMIHYGTIEDGQNNISHLLFSFLLILHFICRICLSKILLHLNNYTPYEKKFQFKGGGRDVGKGKDFNYI